MEACKRCRVAVGVLNADGVHESEGICRDLLSDDPERVADAKRRARAAAKKSPKS